MPNQEAIERFLNDVYGYGKIGDFLKGEKPDETSLRNFLAVTIIGTYRTSAISDKTAVSSYAQVRVTWPRISKVLSTGEAQQREIYEDVDANLPFHINNATFFHRMSGKDVGEYVRSHVCHVFRNGQLRCEEDSHSTRWFHELSSDGFRLTIRGTRPTNSKFTLVDFVSTQEYVEALNKTVRQYYGFMNRIAPGP